MFDRLSAYAPHALALLRIVSALLFIHGGVQLLFGWPGSTYPAPPPEMNTLLTVAGTLELVGGLLLLVGFLTRPVAFILSGMMAVAYWGFHFPMNPWPNNNMGAASILFCFIYLYLFCAGPGAWAVDNGRSSSA
jgi:putative oxidoreductase